MNKGVYSLHRLHCRTLEKAPMKLRISQVMERVSQKTKTFSAFCLANFTYERFCSRRLLVNKALINVIPRITLPWVSSCNTYKKSEVIGMLYRL